MGYTDSSWGDRLTSWQGTTITYDEIGNPTWYSIDYLTCLLTWNGRQLTSFENMDGLITYTYNDEGIRISRTVSGVEHKYQLNGTQIVSETWGNHTIFYVYDEMGAIAGMRYRTSNYAEGVFDEFLFEKNLQGDVVAIYNASGTKLVSYTYDAWGKVTTTYSGGGASTPARFNPFKYRGYYHDSDTNLYYLNSRYYDPATGRFISADGYVSTGQGILGYNMYAYCGNNPIMRVDPTGNAWYHWLIGAVVVVGCAVAVVATAGCATAGIAAVAAVANGMAAATTASTIAAGAFIGASAAYGSAVMIAAMNSDSINEFNDQGNWGTVATTTVGMLFGGYSGYVMAKTQLPKVSKQRIFTGTSAPPEHGATPNSRYLQYDQSTGQLRTDTVYNNNGDWYSRVDYMHDHKINGVPYMPHIHISAPLNQKGQPIGREFVLPW